MSRYQIKFGDCRQQRRIAFIPFVMLGDPAPETSLEIIKQLIDSGADALELGIPFSDPVADGAVIQAGALRALKIGVTPQTAMSLIASVRAYDDTIPIGLLVYANLVVHNGIDRFYRQCRQAGVDSVLIADVPLRETPMFDRAAHEQHIDPVHILPPDASEQTLAQVAEMSSGYTYVLGRAGVTGAHAAARMPLVGVLARLVTHQAAPPVLGFGVSTPDHVRQARLAGFSGVICGSAIVAIIERHQSNPDVVIKQLRQFVSSMKLACIES